MLARTSSSSRLLFAAEGGPLPAVDKTALDLEEEEDDASEEKDEAIGERML